MNKVSHRPQLFSIHGIFDSAHWQIDLSKVFAAEFDHVRIRYREYHFAGALQMFIWPWYLISLLMSILFIPVQPIQSNACIVAIATVVLLIVAVIYHEFDWSGWTWHLAIPFALLLLAAATWQFLPDPVQALWFELGMLVFWQELREYQCDWDRKHHWWPYVAFVYLVIGALLLKGPIAGQILYVIFGMPFALWEAKNRRNRALLKFQTLFQEKRRHGSRASLVAHSFGTYLTCRLIAEHPTFVRLDKLVLCGAIVPEAYDWDPILTSDASTRRVQRVRNEFGALDWAVPLATYLRWGSRCGYGRSGVDGFNWTSAHQIEHAFGSCGECTSAVVSPFHNVRISDYDHGKFLKKVHFRQLWLPFFWNIEPSQYEETLKLCFTVLYAFDDGSYFVLAMSELQDFRCCWNLWPQPMSISEWLKKYILQETGSEPTERDLAEVAFGIASLLAKAIAELEEPQPDLAILRYLHPSRAATAAVDELRRSRGSTK